MRTTPGEPRPVVRTLAAALLLASAAPSALRAQALGLGFFGIGLGRDHAFPDDREDEDDEPEYSRSFDVSWSAGLTLVLAKSGRTVTAGPEGDVYGPRRLSPSLWPLFFWDAQAEAYVPGRDCRTC